MVTFVVVSRLFSLGFPSRFLASQAGKPPCSMKRGLIGRNSCRRVHVVFNLLSSSHCLARRVADIFSRRNSFEAVLHQFLPTCVCS